ncbi:MAG TPA: class I lanthipeptide [Thermoanaerobaculia bacterium]|nr:class I lanthipeptide [Thermoanaerobaculia bacterium]
MKKLVKKLELNKETLRNLSTDDLKKIAGGTVVTKPISICGSCRPTLCP